MNIIDLDGIAEKKPVGKKEPKPLISVDSSIVTTFVKAKQTSDSAEQDLRKAKNDLLERASVEFWKMNHARTSGGEMPASTAEMRGDSCTAKITLARIYPAVVKKDEILSAVPKEVFEKGFQQSFEIKVDGSKIPPAHAQEFINGLKHLMAKCDCSDAVSIKSGFQPTEQFHLNRHKILVPEKNAELQMVCPARMYVS